MPALLALTLLTAAAPARAQQGQPDGERDWQVELGGIGFMLPVSEGSDDSWLGGSPAADISYRSRFFLNAHRGLGAYVVNAQAARVGISAYYARGRDEDDSRYLAGTGDIDDGVDLTAFAEYSIGPYGLSLQANRQMTGHDTGTRVELGAAYSWLLGRRGLISPRVSATYASGEYMDAFFSVTSQQAAASGHPQYHAGAGVKSVSLGATGLFFLNEKWSLLAVPLLDYLIGDAATSPLVQRRVQAGIVLGVLFRL